MAMNEEMRLLRERFAAAVVAQNDAIFAGDARGGNKHAKRYVSAVKRLFSYGDEGRETLKGLLHHDDPGVRTAAAAYLLRYATHDAMKVLRLVAKGEGMIAFEADECIKRWNEGNWHLDEF